MKILFTLIVLLGLSTSSCRDSFISLVPEDQYSADTFYKTEPQFRLAVTAAYVPLRGLFSNDFYMAEMRSDNTHYELSVSRAQSNVDRENICDFTDKTDNSYTSSVYFSCYSGILKANTVIEKLADTDLIESAKSEIDGEAKFLRAFYYFKLVRYYGGVPLFLKVIEKAEEAFLTRSSSEQIYDQIIADAKDAIVGLAKPATFPQSGHATKGSATMLLAEVYMTQKKYAEAEILLNTLSAMGYVLNANYADAFLTTNKNSKESLFEVQYLHGVDAGSQPNDNYVFYPKSKDVAKLTGILANNTGMGGWNTPTKDLVASYEPNDKRLDASIGVAEGTYDTSGYLTISANKSILNYTPAAGKIGVLYVKKYLHAPHIAAHNANDNWPVYRYSDALLLLAECLNEQGKSSLSPLNTVRTRAGLPAISETNQTLLRSIIAHERRMELAFENHRWHDLVRTGKAIEVMTAYGLELKKQYSYLTSDSYNVTSTRLLFPIPQSERNLNPALIQNPGYN